MKKPWLTLVLIVSLIACDSPTTTKVTVRSVLINQGDPWNNVAPFGGASDQRYQQVYAAHLFDLGGDITAVTFFSPGQGPIPLASADYRFRLFATPIDVMGLSHDMDSNLSGTSVTVLDERIEGLAFGTELTFRFSQPFTYNPAEGHLLLDVTISNAVDDGQPARVFTAIENSNVTSRRPGYGGAGDGHGLVTRFEIESQ